jgi:hypothetical protein
MRVGATLLLIFALLADSGAADTADLGAARELAREAIRLAMVPNPRDLADRLHYPPVYSESERKEDSLGVSESLQFLFERLGTPRDSRLYEEPVFLYEFGVTGGTLPYWESLSPISSIQFVYSVLFSHAGSGFLKFVIFRPSPNSSWEIQAVSFGLPESPAAKVQMIELMLDLSAKKGLTLPPNYRHLLEEQLRPSQVTGQAAI